MRESESRMGTAMDTAGVAGTTATSVKRETDLVEAPEISLVHRGQLAADPQFDEGFFAAPDAGVAGVPTVPWAEPTE